MSANVIAFPHPAAPDDKNRRSWLKPGDPLPDNVQRIRKAVDYDPQPIHMTMERAALCAIFEVLKPKQRRKVLGRLWRLQMAGDEDTRVAFYVARAMLRGAKL